ncbi:MAG: hypothetical protein SVO01_07790 [Thermotogota bacterium]|nr:hypothetical protein [Thermotogota bacterium]
MTKKVPKKREDGTNEKKTVGINFLEALEISQTGVSSVELKRNSKGTVEIQVKCYNSEISKAAKDAMSTFRDLDKKYPVG